MPQRINADANIYAFKREKDRNQVIGILNLSAQPQTLNLTDKSVYGSYTDYFSQQTYELAADQPLALEPWQYLVFVTN